MSFSWLIYKKVISECFAARNARKQQERVKTCSCLFCKGGVTIENIKFYEVNQRYIRYLGSYEEHLFHNKKVTQKNERKYIGIILYVNGMEYFVPLSSFKEKHKKMKERLDFIKVKDYAVINLNNMFPVPVGEYTYVEINKEKDLNYRALLLAEYRYIKGIQGKIRKSAQILYNLKIANQNDSTMLKRCNDFRLLEELCKKYKK